MQLRLLYTLAYTYTLTVSARRYNLEIITYLYWCFHRQTMGWTFHMFYTTVSYLLLLLSQAVYCNVDVVSLF